MNALAALNQEQLRRIDDAIARISSSPAAERQRKACLLAALMREKAELLHVIRGGRRIRTGTALAA